MRIPRIPRPLLVAVIVVLLAEVLARALAPHLPDPLVWDSPWTQEKAARIDRISGNGPVDVVFVGSSVVQSALDPEVFATGIDPGTTAYNAAIPGATVRVWREWVRDVVQPGLCPSVLVIGVTVRDYNDAGSGAATDRTRYLRSEGRRAYLGEASASERIESAVAGVSTLFAYRSILRRPVDVVRWLVGGSVEGWVRMHLTDGGRNTQFDSRPYRLDPDRRQAIRTGAFADFSVGDQEELALRRIVRTARDAGTIPVIVEMPVMESDLVPLLPHGADDFAAFRASLERVADRTGAMLVRIEGVAGRAELFADEYHVNAAGMREVTGRLAEVLGPVVAATAPAACSADS